MNMIARIYRGVQIVFGAHPIKSTMLRHNLAQLTSIRLDFLFKLDMLSD